MKKSALVDSAAGFFLNFMLFTVKLYIGVSSNSLPIYCDAFNNLGDTFASLVAFAGFIMIRRMSEKKSLRAQSLCTFVISIFIIVTGFYFIYNGLERVLYPVPVAASRRFIIIICATIVIKLMMGFMFRAFNKKAESGVLRALMLDSFLDCFITAAALMGFVLVSRVRFAVDGTFAIITGTIITVSAVKNLISEAKYLINN